MKPSEVVVLMTVCGLLAGVPSLAKPIDVVQGRPLKVYILAGQSNMTGMVKTNTLEHIRMFPDTAKEFAALFNKDGSPVVLDDVYVSQWMGKDSGKLAPRYGGGKSGEMFGPEYNEAAGYELAGFVWFQGWNDMINSGVYPNRDLPRGYEQYTWLLEHFIRDVRKDLNAAALPFVIGVLGVGGVEDPPTTNLGYFQQAQAAVADEPEFKGTVAVVQAGKYWDPELAALDAKSHQVGEKKRELKYGDGLEGEALEKAYAEYRAKHITPREEEILKNAVSNGGFHYLGSAKIMAGVGKGFAEAMLAPQEKRGE